MRISKSTHRIRVKMRSKGKPYTAVFHRQILRISVIDDDQTQNEFVSVQWNSDDDESKLISNAQNILPQTRQSHSQHLREPIA